MKINETIKRDVRYLRDLTEGTFRYKDHYFVIVVPADSNSTEIGDPNAVAVFCLNNHKLYALHIDECVEVVECQLNVSQ